MPPTPDTPSPVCVFCGKARRISDGRWIVSMMTPRDCEHETIDGRT
jgi:hypothetical protein